MKKLICSTFREGYGIDQIRRTMTAGELINFSPSTMKIRRSI